MGPLIHLMRKEWLLLRRDWHALFLLFLMPTVFILIMSLALRGLFAGHGTVALSYLCLDRDQSPESAELGRRLALIPGFRRASEPGAEEALRADVLAGREQFLVLVPAGFGRGRRLGRPVPLEFAAAPGVDEALVRLFDAGLRACAVRYYLEAAEARLALLAPDAARGLDPGALNALVRRSADGTRAATPTSVQQNVPAWLIFAMFFIAIPLSNTWVQERSQGTYARLLSFGLPRWKLLLGKLVPYMAVNLVQAALMFAVGARLVPLLGGDALRLGSSPAALAAMVLAVSFASVSYALLVAGLARTSEQATLFTGVSNLLMAVLGGVMVPRFVMPPALRALGGLSPMAWGLDGFLEVFLRGGGLRAVAGNALLLAAFGAVALACAAGLFRRERG